MTNDALIEEINSAYRRLSAAAEDLLRADRELAEHVRRVRLDNAEAILEAKNERTASLRCRESLRHRVGGDQAVRRQVRLCPAAATLGGRKILRRGNPLPAPGERL